MSGETIWWVLSVRHRPSDGYQELAVEAKDAAEAVKVVAQMIGANWEWVPESGVEPMSGH